MSSINLLPWREKAHQKARVNVINILVILATITLAVILMIQQLVQQKVIAQELDKGTIQKDIAILDKKIKKIAQLKKQKIVLTEYINTINQRQINRTIVPKTLTEIAKIIPDGVYLTSIKAHAKTLFLKGKSETNKQLTNIIRSVEKSEIFSHATVKSITSSQQPNLSTKHFQMQITIKR